METVMLFIVTKLKYEMGEGDVTRDGKFKRVIYRMKLFMS